MRYGLPRLLDIAKVAVGRSVASEDDLHVRGDRYGNLLFASKPGYSFGWSLIPALCFFNPVEDALQLRSHAVDVFG